MFSFKRLLALACIIIGINSCIRGHVESPTIIISIDLSQDDTAIQEQLLIFPENFFFNDLSIESDVTIQDSEKPALFDCSPHSSLSRQDLFTICQRCKIKRKFSNILFQAYQAEDNSSLSIKLQGFWTFNKVIIKGLLSGIDTYKNLYLIEYGEPFDIQKHEHSLKKIRTALLDEGYFEHTVFDYLEYDEKTKSISVVLALDTHYRFYSNEVCFDVKMHDRDNQTEYLLQKKLTASFSSKIGKRYFNQHELDDTISLIKNYLAKKGFFNSEITLQKEIDPINNFVRLKFLILVQKKKAISFLGNQFYSSKELLENILAFGHSTAFLPDSFLCQEIVQMYYKKGFFTTKVDCKKEEKRNYFLIQEGPRALIKDVQVSGIKSFDEKTIKNFFCTLIATLYDEDLIKLSVQYVTNFFQKEGFLEVKCTYQQESLDENNHYALHIILEEGVRYYLTQVTVINFQELSTEEPFAVFNQGYDIPFSLNRVQEQRQWLINYFHKNGFLYVDAKPSFTFNGNKVTLEWLVTGVDQKVTFGKTIVQGSTNFPYEYIVRELTFKEGQLWQKEKLDESIKQLQKLGIFSSIHLYPNNIGIQESQKDIVIRIQEDDPFEIRTRVGFQQVSKTLLEFRKGTTYKLGGTLLYKNPFNVADCFCVDTDFTRFYRYFSVEYNRPWFFSMPLNTVVKIYNNKYTQPVHMGSDKALYQAIQQGLLFGVNRCCCNCLDYGCNLGLEVMETNNLSVAMAEAINFETNLIDKKVPYLYTEPTIVIDYLDNDLNPTSGSLTVFSSKAMIPLVKIGTAFVKMLVEQSVFIPISPLKSVLGLRIRAGHIFYQDFNNIMPPERFYLGGQNSLRSYEPDLGPPLGSFIDEKGKRILVPQGGKTMFNMNIELRFPLYKNVGGVIFQDFGTLIDRSITEVIKSRFLAGTGFGIRYYTPVGPLRFDIGWKWRKDPLEDSGYAWFLTLGHAF